MICVNSVNVCPGSVTLKVGEWYYGAYAQVCPTNADCKSVTWSSSNTSVASVNASSGYIYAKSAGTAKIYATATDGSGKKDYCTVTVSQTIPVSSITLNKTSLSLEKGDCSTLTATVCPTNATNKSLVWSSGNASIATVNNGVVCAKMEGTVMITATASDGSGKSASCRVTVTGNTLVTSVTVTPSCKVMTVGDSAYLYETVCPSNATNKCVSWSSSNTNVATVNSASGLVYAKKAGTATIYATAQDGSGKRGSCTVTVNAPIPVESVIVRPTQKTMQPGESANLTATIYPSNATNQSVVWCSSNENVATVELYTGKVTALMAGTTLIKATTVDGEFAAGCMVEVVLTDKQLSEQIMLCLSLLTEYSSYAYLSPMQYADLKGLDSEEAAIVEQTELLQSIQLINYILFENRLVANSPTAITTIAKHILSGEKYDIFEQAEITQDIRDHSDVFDEVWKERNKQSWLELAQLLLALGTMIPYVQIPASLVLLGQGIVGKDLTGRQLPWWERALNVTGGVLDTIEGVGFIASAIKNSNKVKILDKLDDIAKVAGDHAASECAYALRTGRISNRVLNGVIDAALINKVQGFRGSFNVSALRIKGNVAVAEVNISGLKTEWFAHSKIHVVDDITPPGAVSNISLKPTNSVFKAIKVGTHFRDVDTEYKILSDIANAIGDNYSISGKITLFTEWPPCASCAHVIAQFTDRYKNILIEVVDNGGNILFP